MTEVTQWRVPYHKVFPQIWCNEALCISILPLNFNKNHIIWLWILDRLSTNLYNLSRQQYNKQTRTPMNSVFYYLNMIYSQIPNIRISFLLLGMHEISIILLYNLDCFVYSCTDGYNYYISFETNIRMPKMVFEYRNIQIIEYCLSPKADSNICHYYFVYGFDAMN